MNAKKNPLVFITKFAAFSIVIALAAVYMGSVAAKTAAKHDHIRAKARIGFTAG